MDEQQDVGSPNPEAPETLSSRPGYVDVATQTREDVSRKQRLASISQYAPSEEQLASILQFTPSEEPDQDELNAEITQGHWRCHLKRFVRLDRGRRSDPEFYSDRRQKNASWNGVALSRPFAPRKNTSNREDLHIIAKSAAPDAKVSSGIDNSVESIYHLYRTIDVTYSYDPKEIETEMGPVYHLEIKSPLIIELLRNIVLFHPTQDLNGKVIMVPEPYMLLWHHHRALRRFNEDFQSNEDTKKHLQVLISFLDSNRLDAAEFKRIDASGDGSARVAYRNAWYLYRPGAWLLCRQSSLGLSWMSIVESIQPAKQTRKRSKKEDMRVSYRFVRYNGSLFEWCSASKYIKKEDWSGNIVDAELVPVEFIDDQMEVFASLRERGLRYWQLQGQHLRAFTGSETGESQEELDRVMIDEATYQKLEKLEKSRRPAQRFPRRATIYHDTSSDEDGSSSDLSIINEIRSKRRKPRSQKSGSVSEARQFTLSHPAMLIAPGRGALVNPDQLDPSEQDDRFYQFGTISAHADPENIVLMACHQKVSGFSLRQKQWKQYNVDDLGDVHFRGDAFKRLVLDENYKYILRTMIEHHRYQRSNQFKDLVEGKGQGLIILLHGPPGVGKTLAAESIADLYQRPLYSVTSGDIGTKPGEAEMSIGQIFEYAVNWKAIVLIDEADIFLAQRDMENIERNALVSVFLRNLEYFDGIMVLTTNRVGVIDEAFQSRLDVALALELFTVNERKDVWYNFIEDLPAQTSKRERDLLRREVEDVWSHKNLNGRQIRNCVKTASVLAKQHGENINARHIRTTIRTVLKFSNDIRRVYKMDPERRAEMHGIRNHPSAKATEALASSGRSGRAAVTRSQRGHRSSSLEMEEDDEEDLGSDV